MPELGRFPCRGELTRRLRRRRGLLHTFFDGPKGCRGNGEKCQPSGLSAEGGNDSEFRQTTSGAHGSASRADCLPRGKPHACDGIRQLCRMRTPAGGMTRRLRRGSGTCRPMGRSHFSFDGERKVCKRKPAARRLQRRPAPLRVIRKYRRSGHCRARLLYLLRPASR